MFYASKHKASVKHVPWLPIPTEHNNNNKKREEKKLISIVSFLVAPDSIHVVDESYCLII